MMMIFNDYELLKNEFNIIPIKTNIDLILSNNYFDCRFINNIYNTDIKLIYYLINNFYKLLESNNQSIIQTQMAYFIISIIQYTSNSYLKSYNISDIRKYDLLITKEPAIISDSIRIVGLYQELLKNEEIDDEKIKDKNEQAQEEFDALDIDDYEIDDDIDNSMEALDT
jgi:hypothetical protein